MRTTVKVMALAAALAALVVPAPAAAGSPAQIYYVPLPEDQVHAALRTIFPGDRACSASQGREVGDPIVTYLSITPAAAGTRITYDHWEDGYEPDISHPVQPSTEVWGDGDDANGVPPGFAADLVGPGSVVVLHNPVRIGDRGAVLDFDGGDKLAASAPISVTRAAWATGTSTMLAGAVEVRDLRDWGRSYRAPVGQDVPGTTMFEHTSLLVMASRDGTQVAIDADADGSAEIAALLDEGQSHHVLGGVRAGAAVTASEPVQVALVTGDVCAVYESRWFSLEPEQRWSASAYTPVGATQEHRATVYVFNPGAGPVSVVRETRAARDAAVAVAAGEARPFAVPEGSGARFSSVGGEPILAVAALDTEGSAHEWGFSLIPESRLTPQALIGWGAGRDPLSSVNLAENGSPVWVTPVLPGGGRGSVAVCVDYNGDNRGALADAGGLRYDRRLALQTFQSFRVYDPDRDQTGMILYVCDESGARIAVAWGQDPSRASPGSPGIDLGTTVPPLPAMSAVKDVELAADADGDGLADPGDRLRYLITVRNVSRRPVTGLVVSDELPAHTTYVENSALLDAGGGPVVLPDAGLTPFPLDEGGASLGTLPAGGALAVSFLVEIEAHLPADVRTVLNRAVVRSDTGEIEAEVALPLVPWEARPSLALGKSAVLEAAGSTGTGTLGYWKNHPEAWPVDEIAAGGSSYPQGDAIALMGTPGRGDKSYDLFRQFAAATLNALGGSDASCIAAALAEADAWLSLHPPGSSVRSDGAAWRGAGAALQATLDDYNNGLLCAPHRDSAPSGAAGQGVVFTVIVTNTGNVDLEGVTVQDPAMPACDAVVGTLPAFGGTASVTCRAAGVQGDLTNVAVASGAAPGGVRVEARAEAFVDGPDPAAGGDARAGVRGLAHWRALPEAWPVPALTIGGETRTREGILGTLSRCRKGDQACALLGQLAAARLNLLGGADPSCVERTVRAADAWLASYPPGKPPATRSPSSLKAGKRLGETLGRYNRGLLCAPAAR